jgi:RimJ/RimL family protein N-acetyltransferase
LALELANTGELLGHVGFSPFGEDVEVSYAVAEHARGRGYGSEALRVACNWIAIAFGIPTILAITSTSNHPSRRVLEKSSFAHSRDEAMLFQGTKQSVSLYTWSRT